MTCALCNVVSNFFFWILLSQLYYKFSTLLVSEANNLTFIVLIKSLVVTLDIIANCNFSLQYFTEI